MVEVVGCDLLSDAIGDVLRKDWLSQQRGFVPCAYGAPVYIVRDVSINAGPIHCFSSLCLHLLHPLVGFMKVSKGAVKVFWGNADFTSLQENTGLKGQLVLGTPEVSGDPLYLFKVVRLSPKGEAVHCAVYWVMFDCSSNGIQL